MNDSGADVLRRALTQRNSKNNLAGLARDIGIQSPALEAFTYGGSTLAPDVLVRLAPIMFPNAEYVPEIDKLRPLKRDEPKSMGIKPEPINPARLPVFRAGPPQSAPGMVTSLPQPPKRPGGATVIRQMLAARNKNFNIAPLASDLSISAGALEDFAYGRAGLAPEVLEALARVLFDGRAAYDPAIDRLRPVEREEPRPLGIRPPPITETMTLPTYRAGPAPAQTGYRPPPRKARRAGWVE